MCTDLQVIMHKRKTNSTTTQPHNPHNNNPTKYIEYIPINRKYVQYISMFSRKYARKAQKRSREIFPNM